MKSFVYLHTPGVVQQPPSLVTSRCPQAAKTEIAASAKALADAKAASLATQQALTHTLTHSHTLAHTHTHTLTHVPPSPQDLEGKLRDSKSQLDNATQVRTPPGFNH